MRRFDENVRVRTRIEFSEFITDDGEFRWTVTSNDCINFKIIQTFNPRDVRAIVRTMCTYINSVSTTNEPLTWPEFKAQVAREIVAASQSNTSNMWNGAPACHKL